MTHSMQTTMPQAMSNVLGHHLLVELYNCNSGLLDNVAAIEAEMNEAARICGATIVQSTFHRFQPYGVSGVVVISESHLAIHTWPEYGYASVDLYTCGDTVDPMAAYEHLFQALGAREAEIQTLKRGNLDRIKARMMPTHALFQLDQAQLEKEAAQLSAQEAAQSPMLMKGGAV